MVMARIEVTLAEAPEERLIACVTRVVIYAIYIAFQVSQELRPVAYSVVIVLVGVDCGHPRVFPDFRGEPLGLVVGVVDCGRISTVALRYVA